MLDSVDFSNPDIGEARAVQQASEVEATAWAWAAGEAIGLKPSQIIRDAEYLGAGAEVREQLRMRAHVGIDGLAAGGFCLTHPRLERVYGRLAYPRLAIWLQRNFDPASGARCLGGDIESVPGAKKRHQHPCYDVAGLNLSKGLGHESPDSRP